MNAVEDDYIQISYLSQYYYCPRRAGLMMLEQVWEDNQYTAEGDLLHQRVHTESYEKRSSLIILRGLYIVSHDVGLVGKTDCVELTSDSEGVEWPGLKGYWRITPVEYKHGEVRNEEEYEIQLCAQAMCLEEMTGANIDQGFLYYASDRRRKPVTFDITMRQKVRLGVAALLEMRATLKTPPAKPGPRCSKCSLKDVCMPNLKRTTSAYLKTLWEAAEEVKT